MTTSQQDEMFGQILRAMVRQEVAAALESSTDASGVTTLPHGRGSSEPAVPALEGLDPYSLVPFAEHVLREEDGPLHVRVMARRIYALGFQHRWPPKYPDQLERSLNSLASPSQHADKFERVGPRTLRLR